MKNFVFINKKEKTTEDINSIVKDGNKDIKIVLCDDAEAQRWAQKAIECVLDRKSEYEKENNDTDSTFDFLLGSNGIVNVDFVITKTWNELKSKLHHPILLSVFFTKEIKKDQGAGLERYYLIKDESVKDNEIACVYFYKMNNTKKVEIYDEDNSIVIDDDFDTTDFTFYPENKKFTVSQSIKNDCFYNKQTIEYKISANPIEIYMRTLESSHEPPLEYSIKDGVVLESELQKKDMIFPDRIEKLKKEVEWQKISLLGHFEVNLYILSKHPEIIAKEDYRRFLRQSMEKIKIGVIKVEEAVKTDSHSLQFHIGDYGKSIWYPSNRLEKKERDEYWALPEEKRKETRYAKKLDYVEKFNDLLFKEDSLKYIGISDYEFKTSGEILDYIEKLLNKKETLQQKEPSEKMTKTKGFFLSLLLTLFLSWVISWFVDINPFLIFVIVQAIAFAQSIIGGWLGRLFE